jgi:hypothetical protein
LLSFQEFPEGGNVGELKGKNGGGFSLFTFSSLLGFLFLYFFSFSLFLLCRFSFSPFLVFLFFSFNSVFGWF